VVLVDAGPLIALGKLNRLHLLAQLYEIVHIPRAVYQEAVFEGWLRDAPDSLGIRLFLERHNFPIVDVSEEVLQKYVPVPALDTGERHLLSLARTLAGTETLVLIDDELARAEARRLGLSVKGTVGVLVQAFREDRLSIDEIELLLLEIAARPDIWISERLCREVLTQLQQGH
jgi:predicted nucleic acid-binding protein